MMDGEHDIETCARVSERVYSEVMKACHECGVLFEGILFKPNMITSGKNAHCIFFYTISFQIFVISMMINMSGQSAKVQASALEIASYTIRTLQRTLPASVPGVTVCHPSLFI